MRFYIFTERAPDWWGSDDKAVYDNLIFAISPHRIETVAEKIGEPTTELEKVEICESAVFWSFDRKQYERQTGGKNSGSRNWRNDYNKNCKYFAENSRDLIIFLPKVRP